MQAPRILIIDDHVIFRKGLKALLADAYPNAVFGEADSASKAHSLIMSKAWSLILLDIALPGRSGLDVLKEIKARNAQQRVLVLSMHAEKDYGVRVLRSGASGYVTKSSEPDEVLLAVNRVLTGKRYVSPELAEELAVHVEQGANGVPHEQLSDREYEVLRLIASGMSVSQIADKLLLSVKTISTYRSRMLQKMNMQNNAELTAYAHRHNLV